MTPDELRRLDNDLCIIFEKGIKPVKANKFYYFKHPMAEKMASCAISHNDIGEIQRGTWRKYNPYNPYVEEKDDEKQQEDLNIESLDDLFNDDNNSANNSKDETELNDINLENNNENIVDNKKESAEDAPMLPQEEDTYDLQKELEAKFDELFGPIDEDNNNNN